ncbi:MAG: tyrosine-type recombinase/integrase [Gammaproteobacteria bacterium]
MKELLEGFAGHIGSSGVINSVSVNAYVLDVAILARWAAATSRDVVNLDSAAIRAFMAERLARGYSPATVARQLTSYRKFYGFLASSRRQPDPTTGLRNPAKDNTRTAVLPSDVLAAMARAPDAASGDPLADHRAHRDHTLACLLITTGLPVSTIRTLRWPDIDWASRRIRSGNGTGHDESYPLGDEARLALQALHEQADLAEQRSVYCFPTSRGTPMSRQGLCQRIRKFGTDIGFDRVVTPTALRRSAPRHFKRRPNLRAP